MKLTRFRDYFNQQPRQIDAVMFDIDGTLVRSSTALPYAADVIEILRKESFPFVLLTTRSYFC